MHSLLHRYPHDTHQPRLAPLRSLRVKLTLAFVLIGVTGALLVGQQTRNEFDRFLSTRDQETLVDALAQFYVRQSSWNGVNTLFATPPLAGYARGLALADRDGEVVRANRDNAQGQRVVRQMLEQGVPISVHGQTVGYLLSGAAPSSADALGGHAPPETQFLQQVNWDVTMSAGWRPCSPSSAEACSRAVSPARYAT